MSSKVLSKLLTDDPDQIIPNAIKLKNAKAKVTAVKNRLLGAPKTSFIGKLDSGVKDLGSGLGLGAAKVGAHLKQALPKSSIGQRIYDEGIETLLSPSKQRAYAIGVPLGLTGAVVAGTQLAKSKDDGYDY